jgi:hypothetical protein
MQACIPSTSRSASLAWQPILRRALSSSRRVEASAGNSTLAAKEGPEDWLRKQMRLAERMENRKTKVNMKVRALQVLVTTCVEGREAEPALPPFRKS